MSEQGWTLSQIQGLREHIDIQARFYRIEHEHRMRQIIGDDVYEFMFGGGSSSTPTGGE
ncbi:hypothetical protein [Nocardia sp. NPDC051463]|uniref:hypothetical protein n=1 Tax=Nocardia sp. NPDC051463 TaxID=3154845 RepID=UPI00344B8961